MLCRLVFAALLTTKLVAASDESISIRQREHAFADAVRSQNRAILSTLTDKNFRVSWKQGTVIRSLETEVSRQTWIDDVSHLRIESYEIEISNVQLANKGGRKGPILAASVTVTEFWTVVSATGRRIDQRVESLDFWVRQQGGWKLASRLSRTQ